MANRIYLFLAAIAVLVMAVISYLAYSWLGSIGSPAAAAVNFAYYSDIYWWFLWIATAILVAAACFSLARTGSSWALWATFGFFAAFVVIRYFFLENALSQFMATNNIARDGLSWAPVSGTALVLAGAAVTVLLNVIVGRLARGRVADPEDIARAEAHDRVDDLPDA